MISGFLVYYLIANLYLFHLYSIDYAHSKKILDNVNSNQHNQGLKDLLENNGKTVSLKTLQCALIL